MEKADTDSKVLSFGFKSKASSQPLKTKSVLHHAEVTTEETDYIKGIDDNEIKSVKETKKKSGPLVIPLIKKNKWRVSSPKKDVDASAGDKSQSGNDDAQSQLEKQAALELIQDAKNALEENEQDSGNVIDSIPLLMQNQVSNHHTLNFSFERFFIHLQFLL